MALKELFPNELEGTFVTGVTCLTSAPFYFNNLTPSQPLGRSSISLRQSIRDSI